MPVFRFNDAVASGGGVYLLGSRQNGVIIENCLIADNYSGRDGAGVSVNWFADPKLSNCTIANNEVLEEHQRIVDAIELQDEESARLAMRYHIAKIKQRIINMSGCKDINDTRFKKIKELLTVHEVIDFGPNNSNSMDYPDTGLEAAEAVSNGDCERGILICSPLLTEPLVIPCKV